MIPQSSAGSAVGSAVGSAPILRPYQTAAIASVHHQLHELQLRSTLVVKATGTGKTVTFAELARLERQRGGRTLIVVHRDELIKQALRKLEAVGLHADVEKGTQRANTLAKVVVASVQSLKGKRLLRWARTHFTLVIIDEAHHAMANSYRGVLDYFDGAKVVGVTATPHRADGKALGDVFETVAYRYEIRQAIAEEYLVPIVARRVVVDSVDLSQVDTRAGDLAQDQLAAMMADERALRGAAIPLLELARDRQTIGFCVDVAHSKAMTATMNALRPGCAMFVSGETDEDEREQLLVDFNERRFQFLFNCDVLTEGFDAPVCSCVAMLRPTKSWARFVQCGGRGLRLLGLTLAESRRNGKADCLIIDVTGTAGKHKLIGPADCLAGAGEIPDDLREEIERMLGSAQLELAEVIEQAEDEVAKRRESLRVQAVVHWHATAIDPFIGSPASVSLPPDRAVGGWAGQPASKEAIAMIAKLTHDALTPDKLPAGFSRGDAWRLLSVLKRRQDGGLCTYAQAKRLRGFVDTVTLSKHDAGRLMAAGAKNGWPDGVRAELAAIHDEREHAQREQEGAA